MSVYATGDAHGERGRIAELDRLLEAGDFVIFCGDFGYLYRDDIEEREFLDSLETRPYAILFIDGNHENFPAICSYPEETWNGGKIHRIRKNVIHLCRGQVFEIDGLKIFTFGGGYSIDRTMRCEGKSWWQEEMPSFEEYIEGKRNLQKNGWEVDCIITHTLNYKSIQVLGALERYNGVKTICPEEMPLNFYLEDIREQTKYKKWLFGHFHKDREIGYTRQRALWFDIEKLK